MRWSKLDFGKHKGKTIPQIMFTDPEWFFWAYDVRAFKGDLLHQAQDIYGKASSIRVPQKGDEKRFVEYIIDASTGKFGTIHIITGDIETYKPLTRSLVLEVIDMRVPRQISEHDKWGYRNLLSAMKAILFGNSSYKMNKRRCEKFFNDDGNFLFADQCVKMKPESAEAKCDRIEREEAEALRAKMELEDDEAECVKDSTTKETRSAIIPWD
jgi:hypothetical protein